MNLPAISGAMLHCWKRVAFLGAATLLCAGASLPAQAGGAAIAVAGAAQVSVGVHAGRHYGGGRYYGHRHWRSGFYWYGPSVVFPVLPFGYTTGWYGGTPYYYADDVYYVRSRGGYIVAEPPPGEVAWHESPPATGAGPTPTYAKPAATDALVINAKQGQSETQKSFDRIDCERAAIKSTGFEPTAPGEGAAKQAQYVAAVATCLETKGYSVK